jgi:16S rRNA processing protein RimM
LLSENQYLRVGVITSPHGVRGEVRVFPTTEDPKRFSDLDRVYLDLKSGISERTVESVRYQKNMVLIRLSGIADRTEAEHYRNCDILITRDQALPLAEGEFYIADLIGLSVVSDDGETLGTLTDVMETGANDVYIVRGGRYGEILIPAIPDCSIRTDLESGVITVHLLPGLIDKNR